MHPPLEITRRIAAEPGRVWEAFTRAEALREWFHPPGVECAGAECEPYPGGIYRIRFRVPAADQEFGLTGVFLAVNAPKSLCYSWRWEDRPGFEFVSKVEVSFEPDEGGVSVHVRHCGIPGATEREDHERGWNAVLGSLETYLAAKTASPSTQTR